METYLTSTSIYIVKAVPADGLASFGVMAYNGISNCNYPEHAVGHGI